MTPELIPALLPTGFLRADLPFITAPPKCITEDGSWCAEVWRLTGNEWLAASAGWLVAKPLKILLIFVVAFLIRLAVRRLIDKLTSGNGKTPALLRPLKERAPQALGSLVVSERRAQRARTIGSVLKSVVTFLVYGLAFILALGELGVQLGPIIASAGIVGVALGFGAQNLVKDFLSGIFMMLEDQYGVGDVVDVGEASGTIEAVGLRVTTLRDVNGTVWYVRNGEILRVGNSSQGFAVAVVDLPVGYGADVDAVTDLLAKVIGDAVAEEQMSADVIEPPEVLGVEKVTPESITIRMTVKVRPGRQWAVQRALRARAMGAIEEAGIQPPMGRLFPPTPPA
ncbi:mechanosensitive ion channel family protein [Actinokineospora auranticolor]|uniref:Small conductance mechanosensitive channel n=1 Tax=Actinokineospora auranticolor TaxID=155976 RepID=A0A2S6GUY9_9PSEU|nr:mechanosensitive ion channel family protein [Actinokineospora auranticolor]PPK69013.1 small conductance mechanosensitive channel [Actinokineospora auranticolor]